MNLRASFNKAKEAVRSRTTKRSADDHSSDTSTTLKKKGYAEIKRLGKGSFGYAVLIVREDTREQFCAKLIKYKHMQPKEKNYVAREVRTMSHLSGHGAHPYVVRFRESFILKDGPLCIVMDYCDGGDLAQAIVSAKRKRVRFHEEQVHLWLLQILSATDFLHCNGVLHRDIKPANCFMHGGVCKLGDLGLSKQLMSAATQPGAHTQCGSPLYLAPEVHMGQPYSKKLDVWAVGCTLYEMMMLAHAFQGADNQRILQNIIWAHHAPVASDKWSAPLVTLLESMLQLKPDDRPDACTAIKNPLFGPALQSGAMHPRALRHQEELAHLPLAESPTSVLGGAPAQPKAQPAPTQRKSNGANNLTSSAPAQMGTQQRLEALDGLRNI